VSIPFYIFSQPIRRLIRYFLSLPGNTPVLFKVRMDEGGIATGDLTGSVQIIYSAEKVKTKITKEQN